MLDAAFLRWRGETCLVEADRDRETERLSFEEVARRRLAFAAFLAKIGFGAGDRAAILLTNQSKWHVAACAVFHRGGVLVPLDAKLPPAEQRALLAHCRAKVLIVEQHLSAAMERAARDGATAAPPEGRARGAADGGAARLATIVVDARGPLPEGALPWEEAHAGEGPALVPRARQDAACIVYSSGTGGRPKGCVLTHENYLAQLHALLSLHPFAPGVRYLSILPTNHAIDFMVGFLGPYACGAAVIHLRTIRPELVRDAFVRHRITHVALVPAIVKNLEDGLRRRIAALPAPRRALFHAARAALGLLSRGRPNPRLGRLFLRPIHDAFGGALEAIFVGGAPSDPSTLRSLHALGIPVANGYGLTEAGTAVTLDRLDPPFPESVGVALPGVELRVADAGPDGVGEVQVRSATVMSGYLDDPELTRETIVGGWLRTGDLGVLDSRGRLRLVGRAKNMIVTAGGKNVYPEDVERAFAALPVKEACVVAAHALLPPGSRDERLLLVVHAGKEGASPPAIGDAARAANRTLPAYQRVHGIVFAAEEYPRTASQKVRRDALVERLRGAVDLARDVVPLRESA